MASTSKEETKNLGKSWNKTWTMVHGMKVNGYHLLERKQNSLVDPRVLKDSPKLTIFVHFRSIDARTYSVIETLNEDEEVLNQVIETHMNQQEVENFEEDWSNLWNPEDQKLVISHLNEKENSEMWIKSLLISHVNALFFLK